MMKLPVEDERESEPVPDFVWLGDIVGELVDDLLRTAPRHVLEKFQANGYLTTRDPGDYT